MYNFASLEICLRSSLVRFKTFLRVCIFPATVCDRGATMIFFQKFLGNHNSNDNVEINTCAMKMKLSC